MLGYAACPPTRLHPVPTLLYKRNANWINEGDCQCLRQSPLPSPSAPHLDLTPRSSSTLSPQTILAYSKMSMWWCHIYGRGLLVGHFSHGVCHDWGLPRFYILRQNFMYPGWSGTPDRPGSNVWLLASASQALATAVHAPLSLLLAGPAAFLLFLCKAFSTYIFSLFPTNT